MSAPVTIRDLSHAIVARLRQRLPSVRSIELHGGTFDEADLKRMAVDAPCLRLAATGVARAQRNPSGLIELPVNYALVVITRDSAQAGVGVTSRDAAAEALACAAMLIIDRARWGLNLVGAPRDLAARNEYSGRLDATGVALWQITWTQAIGLGEQIDDAVIALSQLWINGAPLVPGVDPAGVGGLSPPFEAPAVPRVEATQ